MAMPLNVRSEEVNQLAEKLAARKKINKTEAVKLALEMNYGASTRPFP